MSDLTLSADDRDLIRSLIIAEPDLVLQDDEVMQRLIGETTGDRKVVDLRDRLVQRLENRLEKLVVTHRTVIAAAYENVAGTNQLHGAVLALIEPVDFSAFLRRLTVDVPAMLGIAEARLCLEADIEQTMPMPGLPDDLADRVLAMPQGSVAAYQAIDGQRDGAVVLRAAGADAELVFGEANPVQSEACMRLDLGGAVGMVVFGAADPKTFDAGQGTDLLNFFAGVIERLLVQRLADTDG